MEKGEHLSMTDVPPEMAGDSRVLSLLCWSAINAGEHRVASELGQQLLAKPNVSLADKFTALTAAIGWAAKDPVARDHGFIEREAETALSFAVTALEPRVNNIWRSQSVATLPADTSNLCYAYYLLDRFEDVIAMCAEASAHMQLTPRLISLKLVTLRSMERVDDLLELAHQHVDEIEPSALIPVADVAASCGSVELARRLAARNVPAGTDGHCTRTAGALVAIALWNAGKRELALEEAEAIEWDTDNGLGATIIAARLFVLAGEQAKANARMDQVLEVLGERGTVDTKLMAADCLYFLKRYREAAQLYKPYCQNGYSSILHSRLLRSYVESGQRAQARALLDSLPAGWTDDDQIRETAIALAQRAADWPKLLVLAQEQQRLRPKRIGSWLLALVAQRYGGSKQVFLKMLDEVPEDLGGSIRQQAQLASIQLQYGHSAAGLRRLYRMTRANMHEPEAASAYIACLMLPAPLHELVHLPLTVEPGTQVRLTDKADEQEIVINIDPPAMDDLPPHSDFLPAGAPLARQLLNARIGDSIAIEGQFGAVRQYRVAKIESIYRSLLTALQQRLHSAPDGLPSMWSIRVKSSDGELDLHEMTEMLERNGKAARSIFDTYALSPITLGVCANALGVTSLELTQGWPADAAPLRTCNGDTEERGAAIARLSGYIGPIVVDLATLGEIVALDCEAALAPHKELYISSAARQILEHLIEAANRDRSVARAGSVDGQLKIVEFSQEYKAAKLRYLERIKEAIDLYCTVKPAYGAGDTAPELLALESLLGDDEYEALLLAKETNALLLSLDLGLRQFAFGELGISGIWTQPFLANAAMAGSLPADKYRFAVQLLFRSNRTFVSIDGEDILLMCQQGGAALRDGLRKVRSIFQRGTSDLPSCRDVVHEFLMCATRTPMTLGALCALVKFLYEPLFLHPGDLPDLQERADSLMRTLSLGFGSLPAWIPVQAAKEKALRNRREVYRLLTSAVRSAAELAQAPQDKRPLPVEVLKVTQVPEIRLLPSESDSV
jgi:transcription elongation GreA/GreB family factor